jgi:hypothetical protein
MGTPDKATVRPSPYCCYPVGQRIGGQRKSPSRKLEGLVASNPRDSLADESEILSRRLAVPAAGEFVLNPLAFVQASEACSLDGGDVDESIGIAVIRLNKAKAFRRIKPLHGSGIQNLSPLCKSARRDALAPVSLNDGLGSGGRRGTRSSNLTSNVDELR